MNSNQLIFGFAALLAGAAACGGKVSNGTGAGGGTTGANTGTSTGTAGTGATTTTSTGGTTSTGPGTTTSTGPSTTTSTGPGTTTSTGTGTMPAVSPCPPTVNGFTSCAGVPPGFQCTYGNETRPDCRHVAQCLDGTWKPVATGCGTSMACGASQPTAGSVCSATGSVYAACDYGDVICVCDVCANGPCMAPPIDWLCAGPPTTAGCPPLVPNDGTTCDAEGVKCTYGFVCTLSGAQVSCTNGLWLWQPLTPCPA